MGDSVHEVSWGTLVVTENVLVSSDPAGPPNTIEGGLTFAPSHVEFPESDTFTWSGPHFSQYTVPCAVTIPELPGDTSTTGGSG